MVNDQSTNGMRVGSPSFMVFNQKQRVVIARVREELKLVDKLVSELRAQANACPNMWADTDGALLFQLRTQLEGLSELVFDQTSGGYRKAV